MEARAILAVKLTEVIHVILFKCGEEEIVERDLSAVRVPLG